LKTKDFKNYNSEVLIHLRFHSIILLVQTVLRIWDVYPGSRIRIFSLPDPGSANRIREFKYFNPKKWFLSSRKYDPGCSSRIQILTFYQSLIRFRNTECSKEDEIFEKLKLAHLTA
jgi:hypothetical protein